MRKRNQSGECPPARRDNLLTLVHRPIGDLRPDPTNPRRHSKKQVGQIVQSIEAFGFNVPVLVDANDKVIAGHGRLLACQELGWNEVPTLCLDHLTPAQARAFMIADNRLSEIASWDDQLLAEQLRDLSVAGLDFSLDVTGFEIGEIDLRIAFLDDPPEDSGRPGRYNARSRRRGRRSASPAICGWGRHRVLCGNALDVSGFRALMGEERAAWCSPTRPTMCRSMGTRAGWERSDIARSQWPRAR